MIFAAIMLAAFVLRMGAAPDSLQTLFDVEGMDKSVDPGDDFFAYANGTWVKRTEIPPDRSTYGGFWTLQEEADKRTADLIREAHRSKDSDLETVKVCDYYDAYMDEASIETKGLTPLKAQLDAIAAIADRSDLARVLGGILRADVDPLNASEFHTDRPFGLWVGPDFANPDRYVAYLLQGGLGLPDRDYYRGTTAKDLELQKEYRSHIAAVLKLAHVAEAELKASRIYDLERKIADAHASRTDSWDVVKANNPWRLSDFPSRAPGLDWATYLAAAGLSDQPMIVVWHPSAVAGIAALAGSKSLDLWKDYLTFRAIDRASALLPRSFAREQFKFYRAALTGAQKPRDRWKRSVDAVNAALGDAVGKLYVRRYFPAEAKAAVQAMVRNIVTAFDRRIDRLDWMSPATRARAKSKLESLYVGIGYPERWRDYSGLKVSPGDALGNAQRSELFDYRCSLAKLGKAVDRSDWVISPQSVWTVNLPLQNALNFPAATLKPPFFAAAADPVENYGAIGAMIGHEISHSFDDQGSQFDERGRLSNWWTPEDLAHFRAVADRLVSQFDAYEPLPGLRVNGKLTLSENIAHVAGLATSFDAYRSFYGDKSAPDLAGFTGDQRFFLAFAQIFRSKRRPESLRRLLMTDGHAPAEFNADTVRNIDAWYEAFGVRPGRKLYLAPKDRVRVW
jgi:predicted metalloendopeptidase